MKNSVLTKIRKRHELPTPAKAMRVESSPSAVLSRFRRTVAPQLRALTPEHCITCTVALPLRMVPDSLAIITPARASMEAEPGTLLVKWRVTLPFSLS